MQHIKISNDFCLPVEGEDASKAVVQTLGTTQVQHPGHPLWPVPDPRADGARPEVGAALAGVWHAEGVRHLQTGGADPQWGSAGDEQVRKILLKRSSLLPSTDFFRNGKRLEYEVCVDAEHFAGPGSVLSSSRWFTTATPVYIRRSQCGNWWCILRSHAFFLSCQSAVQYESSVSLALVMTFTTMQIH